MTVRWLAEAGYRKAPSGLLPLGGQKAVLHSKNIAATQLDKTCVYVRIHRGGEQDPFENGSQSILEWFKTIISSIKPRLEELYYVG